MKQALHILRSRAGFRRLWIANVVSQLGDWVGWVAVAVYSVHEGDSLLPLALLFAAHHLPVAFASPLAGAVADRYDRRRVLLTAAFSMAALTAAMAVCMAMGLGFVLPILLAIRSAMTAFFTTAERASLPRLVAEDELLVAGALESGTWSVVFCVGMALGGFLSALGTTLALVLDALSFVGTFALLWGLPALVPQRNKAEGARATRFGPGRALMEMKAAWAYVRRTPGLRVATLAKGPHAIAGGASWLALHGLVALHFDGAAIALALGLVHTLRGLGTGLGPLVAVHLIRRGLARRRVWVGFHILALVAMTLFFVAPAGAVLAVLAVLWGAGSGTNWLFCTEGVARIASDEYQGRVVALDGSIYITLQAIAVTACAWLLDSGAPIWATLVFIAAGGAFSYAVLRTRRPAVRLKPATLFEEADSGDQLWFWV